MNGSGRTALPKGAPSKVARSRRNPGRMERQARRTEENKYRRVEREAKKSLHHDGERWVTKYVAKGWRIAVSAHRHVVAALA